MLLLRNTEDTVHTTAREDAGLQLVNTKQELEQTEDDVHEETTILKEHAKEPVEEETTGVPTNIIIIINTQDIVLLIRLTDPFSFHQ